MPPKIKIGRRCLCLFLFLSLGCRLSEEIVKVPEGMRWRDFYEGRVRREGKERPGCGGEKHESDRRLLSRFNGVCKVCRGAIYPGDWIFWNHLTGKARHAPSGWKKNDP